MRREYQLAGGRRLATSRQSEAGPEVTRQERPNGLLSAQDDEGVGSGATSFHEVQGSVASAQVWRRLGLEE